MKLKNLMDVAIPEVSIMLVGIKRDGMEIGYDFINNTWLDNNLFTPNRICTVEKFMNTKFYKRIRENKMEEFGIFKGRSVSTLKDMEFYNGIVLKVSVYIETGKHAIMESKLNRDKINEERKRKSIEISRLKNPPKKKKVHNYKPNKFKTRTWKPENKNPS